jgi:ligand-binding SRPBCC domain-containing protein
MKNPFVLTTWLWLPRPRDEVFAFFSSAHNLQRITPDFVGFQVLTPPPVEMRAGATIDYRLRLHGLPLRWRSKITEWDPPVCFSDIQVRGPYLEWVHTHQFEEQDGGTMVRDQVRYRLLGPALIARLVNRWLVAPDTRRIFEYRHRALLDIFGAHGTARVGAVEFTPAATAYNPSP